MYCMKCGTELMADDRFCSGCGAPRPDVEAGSAAPAAPVPKQAPMPTGFAPPPTGFAPPPVGQAPMPVAPPKKKRGCLIAALVLAGLLVLCCGGVAIAGTLFMRPRDLGVRYTEKDYESGIAKLGMEEFDNGYGKPVEGTQMTYSGSKQIDVVLTQTEVSALMSLRHSPRWPVSDVQVVLKDGNQAAASGMVSYLGVKYPVYVDLAAALTGPRSVSGTASTIDVAGVALPSEYWPQAESAAADLANKELGRMDGLNIQNAEITDGQLHIVGTIPAVAKRLPVGQ